MIPVSFTLRPRIWSQNQRDKAHWRRRAIVRGQWTNWVIFALKGRRTPPAAGRALVEIVSRRAQLIRDDANLRGGAKELVDALVHAGLLRDDSDDAAYFRYRQEKVPRRDESTSVHVSYPDEIPPMTSQPPLASKNSTASTPQPRQDA